jgi:uncharacterized protein YdhG (YjbR/CyaY superfamily)
LAAAPLVRFRRARGEQRQQLKWFTYSVGVLVGNLILSELRPDWAWARDVTMILPVVAVWGIAAAIGIAILRHRLYAIDRIINRTLVYGLLTALLAGVYAGTVLVLGQLFGGVGGDPPSWAVAGATLAVAALFQPARHRIQSAVDRRFNRRKYDAAKTVEAFSVRLRDEVDLDALTAELLVVVDQTIQPTRASLWLRPSVERSPQTQGPGVLPICPIGEVVLPTRPDPTRPARRGGGGGLRRRIPAMGVIDDYLEDLGDSQRAELERIRRIVLDRVPDAEEGRSYGMPAFRYKRKPLLGFAALKDHLSLFPFSPHVVAAVKGRLAGYDLSKGTIRFTEAKPIPEDVIWEILDLRREEIG